MGAEMAKYKIHDTTQDITHPLHCALWRHLCRWHFLGCSHPRCLPARQWWERGPFPLSPTTLQQLQPRSFPQPRRQTERPKYGI
jgi:hypothetical protein